MLLPASSAAATTHKNSPHSLSEKDESLIQFAKLILVIGVLLALGTAAEGLLFQAFPLACSSSVVIAVSVTGVVASAGCFVTSTILLMRPVDPDRESEEAKPVSGSVIVLMAGQGKRLDSAEGDQGKAAQVYDAEPQRDETSPAAAEGISSTQGIRGSPVEGVENAPVDMDEVLRSIDPTCHGDLAIFAQKNGWRYFEAGLIHAHTLIPTEKGEMTVADYFKEYIEKEIAKDFAWADRTFDSGMAGAGSEAQRAAFLFYGLIKSKNPALITGFRSYLRQCADENRTPYTFTYFCFSYYRIAIFYKWLDGWDAGEKIKELFKRYDDFGFESVRKEKEIEDECLFAAHEAHIRANDKFENSDKTNAAWAIINEEFEAEIAKFEAEKNQKLEALERKKRETSAAIDTEWKQYVSEHLNLFPQKPEPAPQAL